MITVPSEQPLVLLPGLALASFPMSTLLQVNGENVLYANLQNQGLTMITGCGHGGVLNLLDYARRTFAGGEHIHAIYGGLHLSPLEDWDSQRDEIVKALAGYGIARIGCNHCTGRTAVEKMLASGLPVPVSYTHLDVYKRQAKYCHIGKSLAKKLSAFGRRPRKPLFFRRSFSCLKAGTNLDKYSVILARLSRWNSQ